MPECDRCVGRGIDCKYTGPSGLADHSQAAIVHSSALTQTPPITVSTPTDMGSAPTPAIVGDLSMNIDTAVRDDLGFSSIDFEHAYETWSEWVNGISLSGPGVFDFLPASLENSKVGFYLDPSLCTI